MYPPKAKINSWISVLALFFFSTCLIAQSDKELLAELVTEEQEAVNALIMYPLDVRMAILKSAEFPTALIKIESLQSQTKTSFKTIIDELAFEDQQMIWDLTRYPNLISSMVAVRDGNLDKLDIELMNFDEVIRPRARQAHKKHYLKLTEIDELTRSVESAFATLISQYPEDTQQALWRLKELPEVLSLLNQNIRLTVLVGEVYANDPKWILSKTDSLHQVVLQQNAEEAATWKEQLAHDSQAKEEMTASAEAYYEDSGFDDEYYDYDYSQYTEPEIIVRHHYYNYPYWFGYPHWYSVPRWRCYPVYQDWGFYHSPGMAIVIFGIPSYHFTHWYFHNYHHHQYWPHLSGHFVNYYHHYPYRSNSITVSVNYWKKNNRQVITERWLKDDGKLPQRFKDFGKFEASRENYNRSNPRREVSQADFAKQQIRVFPELAENARNYERQVTTKNRTDNTRRSDSHTRKPAELLDQTQQPTTRPAKEPTVRKPTVRKPERTTTKPRKPTTQPTRRPSTTKREIPQVKRGTEYHKQTLERNKKVRTAPTRKSEKITKQPQTNIRNKKKPNGSLN